MSAPAGLWTLWQLAEHTEMRVTWWFIPGLFLSLRGGGSQPALKLAPGAGSTHQSVLQEALFAAFIKGTVNLGEKCHVADF